ncbi:uncharacterized protein LOC116614019 [Nematostella vectensis]|uniref:uncharacterized protein LOC116614019 n=1 Tax=Nematostella vectensis TaxID=45351 RepID=UPI002077669C|nr:uncharacterized protein LOC116614019 [Nematostella vectensis]
MQGLAFVISAAAYLWLTATGAKSIFPRILNITITSNTSVHVTWSFPEYNISTIVTIAVLYKQSCQLGYENVTVPHGKVGSAVVTGLEPGEVYCYKVAGVSSSGRLYPVDWDKAPCAFEDTANLVIPTSPSYSKTSQSLNNTREPVTTADPSKAEPRARSGSHARHASHHVTWLLLVSTYWLTKHAINHRTLV